MSTRRKEPVQEAPIGTTWELCVAGVYFCLVAVVSRMNRSDGTYRCVVLDRGSFWSSKEGTLINASLRRDWRRVA